MTLPIVYARRDDLLGSCLMNFAHAWGFAEKTGRRLTLNWLDRHSGRPDMPWSDIFGPTPRFDVTSKLVPAVPAVRKIPHTTAALSTYPALFYPHTSGILVDDEPKMVHTTRVRGLLATLQIHPAIIEACADVPTEGYTAVHIRRGGDLLALFSDPVNLERAASMFVKRYADVEAYRRCIESQTYGPLLIFSNDAEEAERLIYAIPHHSGRYVGLIPALSHLTPTQRDFAEMLLMSRCWKIIGTRSNYSAFAALMGGLHPTLVHQWISAPHIREFVEQTVPAAAVAQVLSNYAAILDGLGQRGEASRLAA